MRRRVIATLLVVLTSDAGCSVRIADLTVAAPRNPGSAGLSAAGRAEGRSCRWWILGVPLGLPQIDEAMDAALAPTHGRLLRDVTIHSDHSFYLLVGQNCYTVRGDVFR